MTQAARLSIYENGGWVKIKNINILTKKKKHEVLLQRYIEKQNKKLKKDGK